MRNRSATQSSSSRSEIVSDRVYRMPVPPGELWARLVAVETYRSWCPWLRRFDAAGLAPGAVWRCSLAPPLPYAIRGEVRIHTVVEPALVAAYVTGDLRGQARIELRDVVAGTEVRVVSRLVATSRPLRSLARVVPGLARRAHDWVLDATARQFLASSHPAGRPAGNPRPPVEVEGPQAVRG